VIQTPKGRELFWAQKSFFLRTVVAQMPSDTMIFITTAVLGFAATLIGLKWLI
jgi:hypothetical protein